MGNYQNGYGNKCPICGKEEIDINCNSITDTYFFYGCPNCGRFIAPEIDYDSSLKYPKRYSEFNYDRHHLKIYLFYNKSENRPFLAPQKIYEEYDKSKFVKIYNLTSEMVENWYPKTFNDKIDKILLWISNQSRFMGDEVQVTIEDLCLLFFMYNKLDINNVSHSWGNEFRFIIKYLLKNGLIGNYSAEHLKTLTQTVILKKNITFVLTETSWQKIYDLQKNQTNNKNVFVAMKFGKETQALREKLKEGLEGYNVRIMDEIEHNHQIVPEMLYEIRNSRFVIAELSHHNNGAYYEAGYALGLGKEVIHICQKSELSNGLHFDVAQVNTIVYENINEIPEKLKKRIQATIK